MTEATDGRGCARGRLTEGEEHPSRSARSRSCRAQDGQQTPDDSDHRRDSFSHLLPDKVILGRFERVRVGGGGGGEREAVDDAGEGECVRGSREGVARAVEGVAERESRREGSQEGRD